MRLEGHSRATANTAQKSRTLQRIMRCGGTTEMYARLHLPARLVPRHGDVASASELRVAGELPCRSVTMSGLVVFQLLLATATAWSVDCGGQ